MINQIILPKRHRNQFQIKMGFCLLMFMFWPFSFSDIIDSNLRLVPDGNGGMQVYLNNEWYPIDFSCTESMDFDSGYISDSNSDGSARHSSCSSDIFSDIETPKHTATPPTTKRRSKSRPSSSSSLSNDEGFESGDVKKPSNRGRKTGQRKWSHYYRHMSYAIQIYSISTKNRISSYGHTLTHTTIYLYISVKLAYMDSLRGHHYSSVPNKQ